MTQNRPAPDTLSYRTILAVGVPLMLGWLAQSLIILADTVFLSRLGEAELGAAAIGGLVYQTPAMIAYGLGMGGQILMARRFGENRPAEVGAFFTHLIYLLAAIGAVLTVVLLTLPDAVFTFIAGDPEVRAAARTYLDWRSAGIIVTMATCAFRPFYIAVGRTAVITASTAGIAAVNAVAAWGFIFGRWGLPRLGIAGAGLAAVIAETVGLAWLVVHALVRVDWRRFALFSFGTPVRDRLTRIVTVAGPMVFLYFVSLAGWLGFFVIVEKVGERELAMSNILRSLYMILIIPVIPLQNTTNSLVSRLIGEGRTADVGRLVRRILKIAVLVSGSLCLAVWVAPRLAFLPFAADENLVAEAIPCLKVIGIALLVFAVGTTLFNALSGAGDTRSAFVIEAVSVTGYLAYVAVTALVLKWPMPAVWASELVYWIILGGLAYGRLKTGKWRGIVI